MALLFTFTVQKYIYPFICNYMNEKFEFFKVQMNGTLPNKDCLRPDVFIAHINDDC